VVGFALESAFHDMTKENGAAFAVLEYRMREEAIELFNNRVLLLLSGRVIGRGCKHTLLGISRKTSRFR
jgi:hypothetical protein